MIMLFLRFYLKKACQFMDKILYELEYQNWQFSLILWTK